MKLLVCLGLSIALFSQSAIAQSPDWPVETTEKRIVSSWGTAEYVDVFRTNIFPTPDSLRPDGNNRNRREVFAHTGIDIWADAGAKCIAIENMRVIMASPADHLYRFESMVDSTRAFVYAHVVDIPNDGIALVNGTEIQAGVAFATVGATSVVKTTFPHLHFGTASTSQANAANHSFPADLVNPFFFPNLLENDPGGHAPVIRTVYVKNLGSDQFLDESAGSIYGTVEVSADISDNMNGAIDPQTKNLIGNEVTVAESDGWSANSERTSGIVASPYKLEFGIENSSSQQILSNEHEFTTYDKSTDQRIYGLPNGELPEDGKDAYFAKQGNFPKHVRYRYIYDLTSLEDENSSGFVGGHWVTNLRRGATDENDVAHLNSDAEFPDGEYTLKIHAADVIGGSGHKDDEDIDVVVDNFAPYVASLSISPGYSASWYQDGSGLELDAWSRPSGLMNPRTVTVGFSEAMDPTYAPAISVGGIMLDGAPSWPNEKTFGLVTGANPFSGVSGAYQVEISGARDLAGNEIDADPRTIAVRDVNGNFDSETGSDKSHTVRIDAVAPVISLLGWYGADRVDANQNPVAPAFHPPGTSLVAVQAGLIFSSEFEEDEENFISGLAHAYSPGTAFGLQTNVIVISPSFVWLPGYTLPNFVREIKFSAEDHAGNRSDTLTIEKFRLVSEPGVVSETPPAIPGGSWTFTLWSGHELVEAVATAHVKFYGAFKLLSDWEISGPLSGIIVDYRIPTTDFEVTSTGNDYFQLSVPVPQVANADVQRYVIFIEMKSSVGFHYITDGWGAIDWFISPHPMSSSLPETPYPPRMPGI